PLLLVTAAGLVHVQFGNVNFPVVFQLLIGSIPGVLMGSRLSTRIPTFYLRVLISVLIMLSGIKLIDFI
ncbi:MAG TPA: sulfite exporter TauE/SafE family protein, partial [Paenibacillaceae bacterium]|nr:sulfite exporter TauE/SafE family protein [Paenibacillaceae bacterium]